MYASNHDHPTLRALRREFLAALAMLVAVGAGVLAFVLDML
jgi:hypothetical protein